MTVTTNIGRLQFSFAGEVDEQSLYLSLIDILFAFCYDHRTTQGESTVESAYTITMLSPTLSSFEDYRKYPDEELTSYNQQHLDTLPLRDVLVQSARRTLIYPYLRTWKLVKKIYVDLTKILFLGQRCILKCLLQIHRIFEKTDTYYLLNKLYIEDYCIWLQYLGDNPEKATLTRLAKECNSLKGQISKKDMFDLNIEELEDSLGTESPLIDPSELSPIAEGDNAEEVTPQSSRPRIEVISSVQFDNKKDDENTQSG